MTDEEVYAMLGFCPACGVRLIDIPEFGVKVCDQNPDHTVMLTSSRNEHGDLVIVFDPSRPDRV